MASDDRIWNRPPPRNVVSRLDPREHGPVRVVSREVVDRVRFQLDQTRFRFERVAQSATSAKELEHQLGHLDQDLRSLSGLLGGVLEALVEEVPDD